MNGSTDDDARLDDTNGDSPAGESRLEAVVVHYERRPDRRTLSPAGDRATEGAWLTADVGAFVDLADAR